MITLYVVLFFLLFTALTILLFPLRKIRVTKTNRLLPIIIIIIMPVLVVALYQYLGAANGVSQLQALKQQQRKREAFYKKYKSPQQLITKINEVLRQHPNSARGWYLLGRLYFTQGNLPQAIKALRKAKELEPTNQQVNIQLAQALYFANNMNLNKEAKACIDIVLQQNSQQVAAHNLLAIAAYEKGDYVKAISEWRMVQQNLASDSSDRAVVAAAIATANDKL